MSLTRAPATDAQTYVAVQNFYARQVHLLDSGDADGFAATFVADCQFAHHPAPPMPGGRDAVADATRQMIEKHRAAGVRRRHWFGMIAMHLSDQGDLHTTYYAQVTHVRPSGEWHAEPTFLVEDILAAGDGELLVRSRTIRRDDRPEP